MSAPKCGVVGAILLFACGSHHEPAPKTTQIAGKAAVRVTPAAAGEWLLLLETLQAQQLMTRPIRSAALVGTGSSITRTYDAPEGWILLDAVAHPSGAVSLLSLRADSTAAGYPMKAMLSRIPRSGASVERELVRIPPPAGTEPPPEFLGSLDRARLVAHGEDLFAVVRWANNGVQAYAIDGASLEQKWVTWVEPPARLLLLGIIGGGFDNFDQGDSAFFVHADADLQGNLYVGVASTEEVLTSHDAFFAENLLSQTDPAAFDFDACVLTRISADGTRRNARLLGHPGRSRRFLTLRVAGDFVVLAGRIKTGDQPGSWDAWFLRTPASAADTVDERILDVQQGDMFWDVAPVSDGRIVAVGSTNYSQNPSGLSVSDARDSLALVLDAAGNIQQRITLPAGPAGRGNEAMSVAVSADGEVAISGVQNAPGTHAEVYSDAFVVVQGLRR